MQYENEADALAAYHDTHMISHRAHRARGPSVNDLLANHAAPVGMLPSAPRAGFVNSIDSPGLGRASVTEGEGRRPFTDANRERLARAADIQQRATAADWRDWMRTFSLTLLKESPSSALFHCSALAEQSQV